MMIIFINQSIWITQGMSINIVFLINVLFKSVRLSYNRTHIHISVCIQTHMHARCNSLQNEFQKHTSTLPAPMSTSLLKEEEEEV